MQYMTTNWLYDPARKIDFIISTGRELQGLAVHKFQKRDTHVELGLPITFSPDRVSVERK
jgi:hypothetical protein